MKKSFLGTVVLVTMLCMVCFSGCDLLSDTSLVGELLENLGSNEQVSDVIGNHIQNTIPDVDEYYSEYITATPDANYPDQWESGSVCDTHEFDEWTLSAAFSCAESGERYRQCNVCGIREFEIVPASGHDYRDQVCQKCGRDYYSAGLNFSEAEDGYILMGIGSCTDKEINVPPTYQGKPVHTVGIQAFMDSQATIIRLPEGVTQLHSESFRNCYALELLELPASLIHIDEGTFFCLSSLDKITIGESNPRYRASEGCLIDTQTQTLILGCKNSIIPDDGSIKIIGPDAFSGCSELESIVIPEGVTTIGGSAFYCCGNLKSIILPTTLTEIGYNCFNSCGLETVVLPEGLAKIEDNTFNYCSELKEIYIPESVKSIGIYAFHNCRALELITFGGTQEQWNNMVRTPDWDLESGNYTVNCVG
ncbi:MAG: leucine-rich repeat protein [Clostridia bacterium]|nr:leucine-rich repeat protein [Clostridia bacterium]